MGFCSLGNTLRVCVFSVKFKIKNKLAKYDSIGNMGGFMNNDTFAICISLKNSHKMKKVQKFKNRIYCVQKYLAIKINRLILNKNSFCSSYFWNYDNFI